MTGQQNTKRRWRALFAAALLPFGLSACGGILDVDNPNNLLQEELANPAAARSLVNGALTTVAQGLNNIWGPYSTASDEITWIGSRDAWNQLDLGNLADPTNEFSDAAFVFVAEGRWMADEALKILEGFRAEGVLRDEHVVDLARAYLIAGTIYTHIGEIYDDFAFSNRSQAATPLGDAAMDQVFDRAITYLDRGLAIAQGLGDTAELQRRIVGMRMRANHSKAIWQVLNGGGGTLAGSAAAAADAMTLMGMADAAWSDQLTFNAATLQIIGGAELGFNVNERGEMNIGPRYAALDPTDLTDVTAFVFEDPLSGDLDPRVVSTLNIFLSGGRFSPLTVSSTREAFLVLAETALAGGDVAGFGNWINQLRALDGLPAWTGQISAQAMLSHERTANLLLQFRRLQDQYRFGEPSTEWRPSSAAVTSPGTMFPIAIQEQRANTCIGGGGADCLAGLPPLP